MSGQDRMGAEHPFGGHSPGGHGDGNPGGGGAGPAASGGGLPGHGLRVVDLGAGMAAALVSTLLADAGAVVHRVAPSGDEVFDEVYPAHRGWRSVTVPADPADLDVLLAQADVCLVGGEDHPAVTPRHDAADLADRYPRLVVAHLTGYAAGHAPGAPAVDLLVQARTGMVAEHFSDRPLYFAVPFPTYGQAMLAALGVWTALLERAGSGRGQVVGASLQQGAALFMTPFWMRAERPDAEFGKVTPKDVKHLIFQCADGGYVQFVMGVPSAVAKLYRILGIDVPVDPADRGIPRVGASPDTYFGDRPLIAAHVAKLDRAGILAAAEVEGLPAAPVLDLGEFLDDEQLAANGLLVDRGGATGPGNVIGFLGSARAPVETDGPAGTGPTGGGPPLAGVTVLDFGSYVAGPFASRLLADLGASVLKVESLGGDPNRGLQRHFLAAHVGKRALAVDVKTPEGAEVLRRLLARADVVMHNLRPKAAERMGVSPEAVRAVRPDAVTLQAFAFGPTGPRADAPGFDMVIQALLGLERRAGGPDGPPLWIRTPYLDYVSGALGAVAVLMALYGRRTAGRAGDMWVSLLNAGMFLLSDLLREADGTLRGAPPLDGALQGVHPGERLYRTADGWIAIAARTEEAALAMWRVMLPGEPPLPRAAWDGAVAARFDEVCAGRTAAALLTALAEVGVWAEECRTDGLAELERVERAGPERDPAVACLLADRADDRYGRLTGCLGPLVSFSRTETPADDLPGGPGHGAHTRQVLAELGYTDAEAEELLRAGVVR
ncbi:CoA transferase [Streptosporangium amethystogenes subsp. fukuiense]|uniref:CoA transferase n=1 Tax=Streptosporangium amethystogenes subsp. fukuiense TaxID=698418 RepID=A0ABW2T9P2_9ACTN